MANENTALAVLAGGIALAALALRGGGDTFQFDVEAPEFLSQPSPQGGGPGTSGSNQGDIASGTTPAEASAARETTSPGGDAEGPGVTRFEQAAQTASSTGGGQGQQTVTSGGVTQDDDEEVPGINTEFERARDTLERTGSGAGGQRFTQG